jgi:large subunit ribosomal protein L25
MSNFELRAEPRSVVGKKVRFLRREGIVPGNIFGNAASTTVQVAARDVERAIHVAGRTALVTLAVEGSAPTTVLVKKWQRHPYKGTLLHVDFQRVAMTQTLHMDVPIRLHGEAPAIKLTGGLPFQPLAYMSIETLPANIPEAIDVDVSGLAEDDDSIFVRDLVAPEGVTFLTDGGEMVVKIMAARVQAAAADADDAAAAAAAPAPAEPASES